jgi:hypothetical protein
MMMQQAWNGLYSVADYYYYYYFIIIIIALKIPGNGFYINTE